MLDYSTHTDILPQDINKRKEITDKIRADRRSSSRAKQFQRLLIGNYGVFETLTPCKCNLSSRKANQKSLQGYKASSNYVSDHIVGVTSIGVYVTKNFKSKLTGNDAVIKLDITPNRGDCFSILGVARELSALYGSKLYYPKPQAVKETVESPINVKICKAAPSYVGRYITQLDLKKKSIKNACQAQRTATPGKGQPRITGKKMIEKDSLQISH